MNAMLQMIDEAIGELEFEQPNCEPFKVDNDEKAEWALNKIREERAESLRIMNVCKSMILHYEQKLKEAEEDLENKTAYLKGQLEQYFYTVKVEETKTQATYKLPSGTLKLKFPKIKYKRDNQALVEWLKTNDKDEFVKVQESPDWANFKKGLTLTRDKKLVDEDGLIVEGVEVEETAPEFEVEV